MKLVKQIATVATMGVCLGIFGCANSPAADPYAKLAPGFDDYTTHWNTAPDSFKRQLVHHPDGTWTFRGYVVHPPKGFTSAT